MTVCRRSSGCWEWCRTFIPAYLWDSAPLTPKLKFRLALRAEIDPMEFVVDAGVAGVGAVAQHLSWITAAAGQGYGMRFGSAYADSVVGSDGGAGVVADLCCTRTRDTFYRGTGTDVASRVLYALAQTVVTRGDNGKTQPNYSHVLGNFITAGVSNIYRAPSDRSASLTLRDARNCDGGGCGGQSAARICVATADDERAEVRDRQGSTKEGRSERWTVREMQLFLVATIVLSLEVHREDRDS